MNGASSRRVRTPAVLAALTALAALGSWRSAGADGGVTAAVSRDGARRAVAFVAPIAPRTGEIDVSVLLSPTPPAALEGPRLRAVHLESGLERDAAAQPAHQGNRLLRSALLELPRPGRWRIEIDRLDATTPDEAWPGLSFEIEVSPPLPPWRTQWPWLLAWIPITAILFWRDRLAGRAPLTPRRRAPRRVPSRAAPR